MYTRPLVYMWRAIYNDNSVLQQYDDETYDTNLFKDIDTNKLTNLDLIPFTSELEDGLKRREIEVKSIPFLPSYSISMVDERRPIYYRDVYISQEEYHLCKECNKEFTYSSSTPSTDSKYSSPICPHCGSHDYFYCKKCNMRFLFEDTANGLCPHCRNHLSREVITSRQYSRERRWIEYIIGAQETIKGKNTQFKLRIDEYGNCKVE